MRVEVERMAAAATQALTAAGIPMNSEPAEVQAVIAEVIAANLDQEAAIDTEVLRLMEKFRGEIEKGAVDYQKMFGMIKKQLAKERKFVW